MKFRVQMKYNCSGSAHDVVFSNEETYDASFCADDFATTYGTLMNSHWSYAKLEAISNPNYLYEEGIMGNWDGSNYSYTTMSLAVNPCGTVDDITDGTYTDPVGADPTYTSNTFVIGKYHTHPPVSQCSTSACYRPGPSSADTHLPYPPFPMIVRTYNSGNDHDKQGNIIYCSGWNIDSSFQDYPYGNTCTTYFHN